MILSWLFKLMDSLRAFATKYLYFIHESRMYLIVGKVLTVFKPKLKQISPTF